jgi:putative hemolysin
MPSTSTATTPFSLHPGRAAATWVDRFAAFAAPVIDPLLGLTTLERLYAGIREGNFIDVALERLGIAVDVNTDQLQHLPERGPAIVVANHPTGAMDGLALAHALLRRRRDVRLLGNHLVSRVPEMRPWTIAVNPFDPRSTENRRGLRTARAWLRQGGVLVIFPAGEVSNVIRADGLLIDREWQRGVLRLAAWSGAPIVPAAIDAQTSRWFRVAGLIHPWFRTALLPRELLRLRNRTITVRLSAPVAPERLAQIPRADARLAYLRARTDALESRKSHREAAGLPIVGAVDQAALRRDIASLTEEHALLRTGVYSIFCAPAGKIPAVLQEIGRLRELAFRAAGEGTGRATDLDEFDETYEHLLVWNHDRSEVAGAYRVAATDRLCASGGVEALYTNTLFELSASFPAAVGPALELGRSFVRLEYQRESIVLQLLWKGIGALIGREPRYRRLFGPVSISADYSAPSRRLIAGFLETAGDAPAWRGLVRPRRPWPGDRADQAALLDTLGSLEQIGRLVTELDCGRSVPVLIRQYWKLGAQVLGLSVDPGFGGCLDALMIVDLAALSPAVLQRYLGRDGAAAFRAHHNLGCGARSSLASPQTK